MQTIGNTVVVAGGTDFTLNNGWRAAIVHGAAVVYKPDGEAAAVFNDAEQAIA